MEGLGLAAPPSLLAHDDEVGAALMRDHHFPVDNGLAGNIEGTGNGGETLGPVQAVSSVDLLPAAVDVDLDAVPVELNLMKPLLAPGKPWTSMLRAGA